MDKANPMTITGAKRLPRPKKHWVRYLTLAALGGFLFAYGIGVGYYKWPPFHVISVAQKTVAGLVSQSTSEYKGEPELLKKAFTDPVISGDLLYPSIQSVDGVRDANQRIFMETAGFESAYDRIQLLDARQLQFNQGQTPVVQVQFIYERRAYDAYAYGSLPQVCAGKGTASLIIPGSGMNQSAAIALGDPANYHYGILNALTGGGDLHLHQA